VSYDVDIGGESFNYTYNVSRLFHDHIKGDAATGIQALDGLTGKRAAQLISAAFAEIDRKVMNLWDRDAVGEPRFCALYDAANGWGSAVGGILFLASIMGACTRHPRAIVRVS